MSNAKNFIEDSVKTNVTNLILAMSNHLSNQLANKDIEVSPEEICSFFDVAYRPASTPSYNTGASVQTQMPSIPGYLTGAGISPAANKKKGGRSKKGADPNAAQCEYTLSRGKSSGQRCPNTVANDESLGSDRFCKACLKKAAVKSLLEAPSSKSTVPPPILPGATVKGMEETEHPKDVLQVVPLDGYPGFFRETKYGFIVQQTEDENIICHRIDDGKGQRELTESEKALALGMGLQVSQTSVNSATPAQVINMQTPQVPQVPQVPQMPNMPQVLAASRS